MSRTFIRRSVFFALLLSGLLLVSCCASARVASNTDTPAPTEAPSVTATSAPQSPQWFNAELTDVVSGQTFRMSDFAGKVVLVEAMATWCPTCWTQELEVKKLQGLLGDTQDIVLVSLDVDLHEDASTLKEFAATGGLDWYFAVAPLEVDRELNTLYGTDFSNPPLAPMLIIDQAGDVYGLPNGVKSAEALQRTLENHLNPQG